MVRGSAIILVRRTVTLPPVAHASHDVCVLRVLRPRLKQLVRGREAVLLERVGVARLGAKARRLSEVPMYSDVPMYTW